MRFIISILSLLLIIGCAQKESVKVAATSVPHAEMLEVIKPDMEQCGYHLEIQVIDDYQLPNRLLNEGQIDANFFQHLPFLEKEIEEFGYKLVPIAKIHIEPLGIYSKKVTSLKQLKKGAVVTIPSDPTNEARALKLLENNRLIKLKAQASHYTTVLDIVENRLSLDIKEIDAPMLPRTLNEVDLAVIPGNFALCAGLSPKTEALALEDSRSPYVNVLVVRKGDETKNEIITLCQLLTSDKIKKFIDEKYKGKILIFNE